MKKILIGTAVGAALFGGSLAGPAPIAHANVDCYTQTTYNGGTRTTCYSGFPDYRTTVTTCDATHCVTTGR